MPSLIKKSQAIKINLHLNCLSPPKELIFHPTNLYTLISSFICSCSIIIHLITLQQEEIIRRSFEIRIHTMTRRYCSVCVLFRVSREKHDSLHLLICLIIRRENSYSIECHQQIIKQHTNVIITFFLLPTNESNDTHTLSLPSFLANETLQVDLHLSPSHNPHASTFLPLPCGRRKLPEIANVCLQKYWVESSTTIFLLLLSFIIIAKEQSSIKEYACVLQFLFGSVRVSVRLYVRSINNFMWWWEEIIIT